MQFLLVLIALIGAGVTSLFVIKDNNYYSIKSFFYLYKDLLKICFLMSKCLKYV